MTTRLVDDLDGSDAVATVSFALDGASFEIDLSERHLAEFRALWEPFVTAARRVSGAAGAAVSPATPGGEAAVRGSRRTVPRRPAARESAPAREALAVVPSTPPSAPDAAAVARPAAPQPQPQRKGRPLVADPFNQQVRIV